MTTQVPQNIYNAVLPYAQKWSVPDAIWEDVAYTESGFNPRALGDQGTSFGLFQLHIGGQMPSNIDPVSTYDPAINAEFGMPALGRSWQALYPTFNPTDIKWWENFAAMSGHPGGPAGSTINYNESAKLMASYSLFSGNSQNSPADQQQAISGQSSTPQDQLSQISSLWGSLTDKNMWTMVLLVVAGAVVVLVGAYKLVK